MTAGIELPAKPGVLTDNNSSAVSDLASNAVYSHMNFIFTNKNRSVGTS
jgi:hypothetical protein